MEANKSDFRNPDLFLFTLIFFLLIMCYIFITLQYHTNQSNQGYREINTSLFPRLFNLQRVSPQVRQWWDQHNVRGLPDGPQAMNHPTLGVLEFEHVTFQTSITLIYE